MLSRMRQRRLCNCWRLRDLLGIPVPAALPDDGGLLPSQREPVARFLMALTDAEASLLSHAAVLLRHGGARVEDLANQRLLRAGTMGGLLFCEGSDDDEEVMMMQRWPSLF